MGTAIVYPLKGEDQLKEQCILLESFAISCLSDLCFHCCRWACMGHQKLFLCTEALTNCWCLLTSRPEASNLHSLKLCQALYSGPPHQWTSSNISLSPYSSWSQDNYLADFVFWSNICVDWTFTLGITYTWYSGSVLISKVLIIYI